MRRGLDGCQTKGSSLGPKRPIAVENGLVVDILVDPEERVANALPVDGINVITCSSMVECGM